MGARIFEYSLYDVALFVRKGNFISGLDEHSFFIGDLHVLADVEEHTGLHVVWDEVFGLDDVRDPRRFLGSHVEDAVDR